MADRGTPGPRGAGVVCLQPDNRFSVKRVISESAPMHIQRLRFECMMQRIFAGYRTASASSSKVASTRSSSSI